MATTRILLPLEEAVAPTANPGVLTKVTGSGTAPANAPLVTANKITFDQTTDQTMMWAFRLPSDYLSGGLVVIKWSADVNAGNVVWKAGIAPVIDGTTNLLSVAAYNAADVSATVAVPATVGLLSETSWSLTVTNVLAARWVSVFIGRRAGIAADTAAGTSNIWSAGFEYTA